MRLNGGMGGGAAMSFKPGDRVWCYKKGTPGVVVRISGGGLLLVSQPSYCGISERRWCRDTQLRPRAEPCAELGEEDRDGNDGDPDKPHGHNRP